MDGWKNEREQKSAASLISSYPCHDRRKKITENLVFLPLKKASFKRKRREFLFAIADPFSHAQRVGIRHKKWICNKGRLCAYQLLPHCKF